MLSKDIIKLVSYVVTLYTNMTKILFLESLDPSDDPYSLEMAAYLNEDDVLKPGETEGAPDNILKYCVSKKV